MGILKLAKDIIKEVHMHGSGSGVSTEEGVTGVDDHEALIHGVEQLIIMYINNVYEGEVL